MLYVIALLTISTPITSWEIPDLPPGRYRITVQALPYEAVAPSPGHHVPIIGPGLEWFEGFLEVFPGQRYYRVQMYKTTYIKTVKFWRPGATGKVRCFPVHKWWRPRGITSVMIRQ